jgi:hypothetical protein
LTVLAFPPYAPAIGDYCSSLLVLTAISADREPSQAAGQTGLCAAEACHAKPSQATVVCTFVSITVDSEHGSDGRRDGHPAARS